MKTTFLLFPHEPFSPRKIEPDFRSEYEAAREAGFPIGLYSHESLEAGELREALRPLPMADVPEQRTILRGWMLPGEAYLSFFEALAEKGYRLETTPSAYDQAHYLPFAYPLIKDDTARSSWTSTDSPEDAWKLYQAEFAETDAIIKDWVKSAKTRWKEGCFLPAATSEARFREIFRVFREERGRLFNRGVVLREFLPVLENGRDVRGIPLVEETRLFFWRGQLVVRPDGSSHSPLREEDRWKEIACRFKSPFLTIDVARLSDGSWKIIEVGDGGVSGLPVGIDPGLFYRSLGELVS